MAYMDVTFVLGSNYLAVMMCTHYLNELADELPMRSMCC